MQRYPGVYPSDLTMNLYPLTSFSIPSLPLSSLWQKFLSQPVFLEKCSNLVQSTHNSFKISILLTYYTMFSKQWHVLYGIKRGCDHTNMYKNAPIVWAADLYKVMKA